MHENVTPQQAKELIELNKDNQEFIILDIRTPEEFSEVHVNNAWNIDFYNPNFPSMIAQLDKNKTYLVHCKTGGRSSRSMEIFLEHEFENVINVVGKLFE